MVTQKTSNDITGCLVGSEIWIRDRICTKKGRLSLFFFQAEDGIRALVRSRGLGDFYKSQSHCTPDLAATIQAQDTIGWQSFFEGFLATEWELLLDRYFDSINSRRSGRRWCAGLIHQLWLLIHDLWVHRNTILHDHVPASTQLATAQMHASISGQYNQGLDGLSPTHFRSYFSRPLSALLALSESYKRNWLNNISSARDNL